VRGERWAYFSGGAYPLFSFLAGLFDGLPSDTLRLPFRDVGIGEGETSRSTTSFWGVAVVLVGTRDEIWSGAVENLNLDRCSLNFSVTGACIGRCSDMIRSGGSLEMTGFGFCAARVAITYIEGS
jgi:hypothetical protein